MKTRIFSSLLTVTVALLGLAAPAAAQTATPAPLQAQAPAERRADASGSITIDNKTLDYTTRAGTLIVRNGRGEPTAELFYIAYELKGAEPQTRPVTFIWDGGPGGSTMIMDVLGYGPMRYSPADNPAARAPFQAKPNPHTLLRQSDLVFIDLIGTGYSRAIGTAQDKDFWGVDSDANVATDAIERYLKLNDRAQSPKFILGNSYGTTRASVVAYRLQGRGIALNGVILVASIFNYGVFSNGMDHQFIVNLPTQAATAWYHRKTAHQATPLPKFLDEVQRFARSDYAEALFLGNTLSTERRGSVAQRLAGYLGLDTGYIERAQLRVSMIRFRKELLRDQGKVLGRLDGRATSADFDHAGEEPETDHTVITRMYVPAATLIQDMLARMGYRDDAHYVLLSDEAMKAWNWDHPVPSTAGVSERELAERNVLPQNTWVTADLGAAMRANPQLQVFQIHGYYDLATPFAMGDYDLSHMTFDEALRANIRVAYYESGHMPFADDVYVARMSRDLAEFYKTATAK